MKKIRWIGLSLFMGFQLLCLGQSKNIDRKSGTIVEKISSKILNENREVFIHLPESYNQNGEEGYPVVILLDGEVLMQTLQLVHSFYSGGFMPEMVLVGIVNSNNRTKDLTPSEVKMKYGMPYNESSGGANQFTAFIAEELIPHVEKNYRISSHRTLIGHSYGGLFAINVLLNHSELFRNYVAIDPSLDWDNQKLVKNLRERISDIDLTEKSLYMSLGGQLHMQNSSITLENVMNDTSDFTLFARSNLEFSNILKESSNHGLNVSWEYLPEELHGTIAFQSIKNGLIKSFSWFQMENTDKFNSPQTSIKDLKEIIEYRAAKLKTNFGYDVAPYPQDLLNTLALMSAEMGQIKKTKMFLDFGVKFFPESPDSYRAMALYYERMNDLKNAIKSMETAYELSKSEEDAARLKSLKER